MALSKNNLLERAQHSVVLVSARRVMGAGALWWLVALGFLSWSASMLPKFPTLFWTLVQVQDISAALVGVPLLALAWLLMPWCARINWERITDWIERNLLILCGFSFLLYAGLAFWAHHHYAFSMDEYCPLTQSRIFVVGQKSGWVPPELLNWILAKEVRGEFFSLSQNSGYYTSVYWPGLAISQVPFALFNATWLCNPAWGALGLWGVFRLTKRLTGSSEAAAWAWVLMLASPVIALNAASFFAMPAHLTCNIFYCLLLLSNNRKGAFWAGVVGGFALVLHNPVPHAVFALPWIVMIARKERRLLGPLLLGYLIFAVPLGLGWSAFIGSFDASKYAQIAAPGGGPSGVAEILGRLPSVIKLPTPLLIFTRLAGLAKTVVWAVPGLLVVAWYGWRSLKTPMRDDQTDGRGLRLLALSLFWTFSIYWLVPFDQGHGWGFRYIHSAWFALVALGGYFLALAPFGSKLRPFFAASCALSFLVLLPFRAGQVEIFIARHLAQVPNAPVSAASITFINTNHGSFTANLVQNDPFLRNDDWRLLDRDAARNAQLARQYLIKPKREQSGPWGEIWVGSALRHPKQK